MSMFDIQAFARPDMTQLPPAGFQAGWVRVSDLDETIFYSTAIWSREDYVRHWRDAAGRLARGDDFAAFCTDLNTDNASILAAFRSANCVWFEHWVIPRSEITVEGQYIALVAAAVRNEAGKVSTWQVPINAVRDYATR
jgi:hypothetical protein